MSTDTSAAKWFKSSRSRDGGECVEVAHLTTGAVGVRDSKNPTGPTLIFTPAEWDAFTTGLQNGRFKARTATQAPADRSQRRTQHER
ncbi:DUF397 domain-containing protein [Nocardia cerradoensis]|uniref:DUF397 domain-containing protein n=1 Tax=Nocardia cerradoensis TaxID=85688 RepID=UPI001444862D|nr:DUF397 domain-containing protein [Nocardia cerradoensis]